MNHSDIRWKQRFQYFEQAIGHLQEAVEQTNLSWLQKSRNHSSVRVCF
jgi:hypothetical protein